MASIHNPWIDLSRPLHEGMPVYPGDPPFERAVQEDGSCRTSTLRMSAHCGTHIDAPAHYLSDGATVDQIGLDVLCGDALVLPIEEIESAAFHAPRLLLKTNRGLRLDEAELLGERGVVLVGTPLLSIAEPEDEDAVHRALLARGIVVMENLNLDSVEPGMVEMICLPLRIAEAEAAPARVIVRQKMDGEVLFR